MDLSVELVRPVFFRGTLEECWRAFSEKVRMSKEYRSGSLRSREAYTRIAEFCGVEWKLAGRWCMASYGTPRGIARVRLIAFLELQGYQVMDLERAEPWLRYVYSLIGFDVVPIAQFHVLFECADEQAFVNRLAISRGQYLRDDKRERVKTLWLESQRALREKKQTALKAYALFPEKRATKPAPVSVSELQPETLLVPKSTMVPVPTEIYERYFRDPEGSCPLFFFMQGISVLLESADSSAWSEQMKQVSLRVTEQLMAKLYPPQEKGG